MGRPMAANLARAGFDLSVWNRTQERAARFAEELGATAAATAMEAAEGADVTITMLPDSPEVEQVLFGGNGAARGIGAGAVAMNIPPPPPTASREIGERLRAAHGVGFLDAPVTGSRP